MLKNSLQFVEIKKVIGKRSDIPFAGYLWDEEKTKKFNCLLQINNIRQMLQKKLKSCFKSVNKKNIFNIFRFFSFSHATDYHFVYV